MQSKPPDVRGSGRKIDWAKIHERLAKFAEVISRDENSDPERRREILKLRARAIAASSGETATCNALSLIEFKLAHESYAVELEYLVEVVPLLALTQIPGTPPFIAGISNVRGRILSIVDLKRFFDLPQRGLTELDRVLVVRHGKMEIGILADALIGSRSV